MIIFISLLHRKVRKMGRMKTFERSFKLKIINDYFSPQVSSIDLKFLKNNNKFGKLLSLT